MVQLQTSTDFNTDSGDELYDDVITQSALNWMKKLMSKK